MRLLNAFVILLASCALMIQSMPAWAQAQPVAQPDRVGRAVSGSLQTGMQSRGFAMNDPRFGNTLARISPSLSAVAGTAGAITVGAVTAPGWVSAALAIGVGAVLSYAVTVGIDALVKWLFRTDGKIDQSSASNLAYGASGFNQGDLVWRYRRFDGAVVMGGDADSMARQFRYDDLVRQGVTNPSEPTCFANGSVGYFCGNYQVTLDGTAPVSCGRGMMAVGSVCTSYSFPLPAAVQPVQGQTAQQAVTALPASELGKQLNPAIVAALANQAWKNAASQPGYDGLPYPQSNPISATEVASWMAQNPSYAPTVGDFVAPNPTTTANPSPWALPVNPTATNTAPATTPNANTTNPGAANPLQNLGVDPAIGAPTLEETPTAQMILQPILSLLPDLKAYSPSMSAGTCPKPTLSLFGKTQTFEAHCTILEDNRAAIHAAMLLAFTLLALFIILSA
jgi:hypothetical protein